MVFRGVSELNKFRREIGLLEGGHCEVALCSREFALESAAHLAFRAAAEVAAVY